MSQFTNVDLYYEYKHIIKEFGTNSGPGQIQLFDWNIEYTNVGVILTFIDFYLFRKINDFYADNDRPVILDCGANIGYTVLNYKRIYPKSSIIAFEPDPYLIPILKRNLKRNKAEDVEIVESAVWIKNGQTAWLTGNEDGNRIDPGNLQWENTTSVRTVDFTEFLNRDIDLLKVDIEGAEFAVIPHIKKHLTRIKNILVEIHVTDQTKYIGLSEILKDLSESGFQIALNSYSPWRDLIRRDLPPSPFYSEQYFLLAGWRSDHPLVSREASFTPYNSIKSDELFPVFQEKLKSGNELMADSLISVVTNDKRWKVKRINQQIRKEEKSCWTYTFPRGEISGDNEIDPNMSNLLLFEDKQLLGPAHASHNDIRDLGKGRYSHWDHTLYFSTSDDTDPNINNRTYTVIWC